MWCCRRCCPCQRYTEVTNSTRTPTRGTPEETVTPSDGIALTVASTAIKTATCLDGNRGAPPTTTRAERRIHPTPDHRIQPRALVPSSASAVSSEDATFNRLKKTSLVVFPPSMLPGDPRKEITGTPGQILIEELYRATLRSKVSFPMFIANPIVAELMRERGIPISFVAANARDQIRRLGPFVQLLYAAMVGHRICCLQLIETAPFSKEDIEIALGYYLCSKLIRQEGHLLSEDILRAFIAKDADVNRDLSLTPMGDADSVPAGTTAISLICCELEKGNFATCNGLLFIVLEILFKAGAIASDEEFEVIEEAFQRFKIRYSAIRECLQGSVDHTSEDWVKVRTSQTTVNLDRTASMLSRFGTGKDYIAHLVMSRTVALIQKTYIARAARA